MQINQKNQNQSGHLQDGIAAPYDFTIMALIKEAWQRTYGLKAPVLGAFAVIFIALMAIGFILMFFMEISNMQGSPLMSLFAAGLNILVSILSYPILVGIMMMGLHRSIDAPVNFKMAFAYLSYALPIIIASICISILVMLGMFLLIIPGIYLSVAYIFALPLIVDKNMDFWQAMETSRKAVTQHWFKIFFSFLLMGIIYLVSIIPFGIGLIWTIPMFIALHGILYRNIFGIEPTQN